MPQVEDKMAAPGTNDPAADRKTLVVLVLPYVRPIALTTYWLCPAEHGVVDPLVTVAAPHHLIVKETADDDDDDETEADDEAASVAELIGSGAGKYGPPVWAVTVVPGDKPAPEMEAPAGIDVITEGTLLTVTDVLPAENMPVADTTFMLWPDAQPKGWHHVTVTVEDACDDNAAELIMTEFQLTEETTVVPEAMP